MSIETILPDIVTGAGIELDAAERNVNSTNKHMRQLVSLMNQAGQDIVKRAEWSRAYAELTIAANVTQIDLPTDYYKLAETGAIRLSNQGVYAPVRIIVEPASWAFIKDTESVQPYAHIANGKLYFHPDSGITGGSMTYVKKGWLTNGSEFVAANSDQPIFPEQLLLSSVLWRWNRQRGLPYDDLAAEFEANFTAAINADRGVA